MQIAKMIPMTNSPEISMGDKLVGLIKTYNLFYHKCMHAKQGANYEQLEIIETVRLRFLKFVLYLKSNTPSSIIYSESSRFPFQLQ